MSVPDNYSVLLLGGGATMQFSMVPMNLMPNGGSCDYALTGTWAKKAADEAKKIGTVNVVFDGKASGYTSLPDPRVIKPGAKSSYLHITTNETSVVSSGRTFPIQEMYLWLLICRVIF